MTITRRRFLGSSTAALGTFALGAPAVLGQAKARVVVVGGGAGGATAAKYIARDAKGAIEVTLVEPSKQFVTCFHSNLYLGGFKSLENITHGYDKLAGAYGIKLNHQAAASIDRDKKKVKLADGAELDYDRLVLSPGIDLKYDSVPGWGQEHEEVMPHAWKAGKQTQILRARLDAVPNDGVIVMIAPPNPYRCPPGPYERVSMMAHLLKTAGKSGARIVVIDPKESFSKQGLFQEGWEKHYPKMVEWLSPKIHDGLKSVDPKTNTVVTGFETYKNAALVNVIPAQMAGKIARDAGLANEFGLLSDRSGEHEVGQGCQYLHRRRRLHPGRHAEIGVLGQQPGESRGDGGARRADRGADLPGALRQYLLVADRHQRHRQGRRPLRAQGRQDRRRRDVHLQDRRKRRSAQADAGGEHRLVLRHHRRHVLLIGCRNRLRWRGAGRMRRTANSGVFS